MRRLALTLGVLCACGGNPPSREEIDAAKSTVETMASALEAGRSALELLGILPVYDCGEPRRTFVGEAASGLDAQIGCLAATSEEVSITEDRIVLDFGTSGCQAAGHTVTGSTGVLYSGGEDQLWVEVALHDLVVDGRSLPASAGYGTCGDVERYWAETAGEVPGHAGVSQAIDLEVAMRPGLPILGGSSLVLNGGGQVIHPDGHDALTFAALEYELGDFLPKTGTLSVTTRSGTRVKARFTPTLWHLGEAEVTVDDHSPVTVPILR